MTKMHLMLFTSFITGLSGMSINHTHLLLMLLCIESMMLTLLLGTSMMATNDPHSAPIPIIILTMSVCESSIGLVILAASSTKNTNDMTKNLTLLQC